VTLPSTPPVVALVQTLTVVSATPLPTQTALKYELLFVTDKDSTIVINQSMVAFPLELLMFVGDKNKHINGTDWGVTNLNSGACVGAWKEGGRNAKYELPNGLDCQLVGDQIVLKKGDWFGDKEFDVLYDDKLFGTCEKNEDRCLITIFP
jgi:hypothetical protein